MTLDPTDIDAALNDRANWPLAAKCAAMRSSGDKTRRANIAILIAAIRKRDARIAELEALVGRFMAQAQKDAARISELEATISRMTAFAFDESASVPSQVVRIGPTPLAPPLNKITTFPCNSPADGIDEQ